MRRNSVIFILLITFFNFSLSFSSYEQQEINNLSNSKILLNNIIERELWEDKQVDHFTHKNEFSLGEYGNTVLFVNSLDLYFVDKQTQKIFTIPSDIHDRMAILGHSISFFKEKYQADDKHRNILIPHVSFLIRKNDASLLFIKGGYLNFGQEENENMTVLLSGCTELEEKVKKSVDKVRKKELLPQIDYINAQELPFNSRCSRHTEPLFWEMLSRKPETILRIANQVLNPKEDKIEHVFYDFYSFHDVCLNCQYVFKKKQFQNETLINVRKKLAEHFKTDECLLSAFRVHSYNRYNVGYDLNGKEIWYDVPRNLSNAYGGNKPEKKGISAKISSQHQILLNARTTYGQNSYNNHKQNLMTLD